MGCSLAYRGAAPLLAALRPAFEAGEVTIASEPAAADVVLTFFTTQRALEDAYFASDGLIESAAPGSLLIDLSPAAPDFSRDIYAMATVNDLALVCAPLALRDYEAAAPFSPENLIVFAAGEDAALQRAMPLLSMIAGAITVCRNPQAAQVARAALCLQTTAMTVAAVEAAVLVRRCAAGGLTADAGAGIGAGAGTDDGAGAGIGVGAGAGAVAGDGASTGAVQGAGSKTGSDAGQSKTAQAAEAVTGASADAQSQVPATGAFEESMLRAIAAEAFAGPFTIEMMMAQLAAALEAADDADLILPHAEAAQHIIELFAIIGGIDKAPAALALVYGDEESSGRFGLDWSRAESFNPRDDEEDFDEYDDEDDFPLMLGLDGDDRTFQDYDATDPFEYSSN